MASVGGTKTSPFSGNVAVLIPVALGLRREQRPRERERERDRGIVTIRGDAAGTLGQQESQIKESDILSGLMGGRGEIKIKRVRLRSYIYIYI